MIILEREEGRPESSEQANVIISALFVAGKAMSAEELGAIAGIASIGYVRKVLDGIIERYKNEDTPLSVLKIGDKYIMSVKEPYAARVSSLAGQAEISKGAMRILAYISKNEPIIQRNIVRAFGSTTYQYVKELVDGDFVSASREGRSKKLETTQKFKEYFNLSGGQ